MPTHEHLEEVRGAIAHYIVATADYERRDRLWPAHYVVFGTNPLSIAYGAAGIALYVQDVLGEVPERVRSWMLDRPVTVDDYPPGLFVGMAGVADAFWRLGLCERAESVMATCARSPLLLEDPTLFLGAAGWGLANLDFHRWTGRDVYLDNASRAADHLLRIAEEEDGGLFWKRWGEDTVNHGFGYGGSGISLFLLHAGRALGRDDLVRAARRGMEFEITNRVEIVHGWTWPDRRGGTLALPYWGHGSSGVGAVLLRFHEMLGDSRYLELAETVAEGAFCLWSVLPSQVEGLSGVAEYFIDLYRATGNDVHLERAHAMCETILWYVVERPEGITFPGRWLLKVSNDYATGSAGIGMFLGRLLDPSKPRLLVDFAGYDAAAPVPAAESADHALGVLVAT